MGDPKDEADRSDESVESRDRRAFLTRASRIAMTAGLAGGYGTFAWMAGRFLYPAEGRETEWLYATQTRALAPGDSMVFEGPSGETINITRQGDSGGAADFIALSSVCPHLGCQVHWEAANQRYFCPCHNGTFDPAGVGTGGPPGDAGQTLSRYRLEVNNGLLFIEVPVTRLAAKGKPRRGRT